MGTLQGGDTPRPAITTAQIKADLLALEALLLLEELRTA
jgi:hypothetical protein